MKILYNDTEITLTNKMKIEKIMKIILLGNKFPNQEVEVISKKMRKNSKNWAIWSQDEDNLLLDMRTKGYTFREIGRHLGRTKDAVAYHFYQISKVNS